MNFILRKTNTQKCDSVLIINLFLLLDQTFCQVNFKVFVQRFNTHIHTQHIRLHTLNLRIKMFSSRNLNEKNVYLKIYPFTN